MFNKLRISAILISFIFVLSCGEKIPVKELAQAKLEISKALSVSAKKYAPQEINDAEKKLLESHDFIKQDAFDKSKNSAIESRKKAIEAYDKSIPLLAKDTLDIAKQNLDAADGVYAEVLAESEYKEAKSLCAKAGELFEQKSYYPCYEKSLEADARAKEAKNVALAKKDILSKSIAEVKVTLEEGEKYNASLYAKDKVQTAKENLNIAEESLGSLELKKGFAAVEIAGTNADEAYLAAIRETAKGKVDGAEKLYYEAEKSDGAAISRDELRGAKEALDQSKSLFQDSKYKESMTSSDECVRLSNMVLNSMKDSAKEKIAGAELIFIQAKESPGAAIATAEFNGAKDALDSSKTLYSQSRYKDAVVSAAECERLSNIVINTRSKGESAAAPAAAAHTTALAIVEDYFMYKVRYIPQRRDCLWRIAEKYYSNPLFWKNIYKANTDKIRNPNLIWPNMMLKVPKLNKSGQPVRVENPAPETGNAQPVAEQKSEKVSAEEPVKESPAVEIVKEKSPAETEKEPTQTSEKPKEPPVQEKETEPASEGAKGNVLAPETKQEMDPPADQGEDEDTIPGESGEDLDEN